MSDIEQIRERLDDINVRLALATRLALENNKVMQAMVPRMEAQESDSEKAGIELQKLGRGSDNPKLETAHKLVGDAGEEFDKAGEAFDTIFESLGRAAELLMKANQEVLDYRQEHGL